MSSAESWKQSAAPECEVKRGKRKPARKVEKFTQKKNTPELAIVFFGNFLHSSTKVRRGPDGQRRDRYLKIGGGFSLVG